MNFAAIPVIDLMGGKVVRAQRGDRDNYRPIVSTLCNSADPLDVARGLLAVHPFDTLYIADLDAIRRRGHHLKTVETLRAAFPQLNIWVDAGLGNIAACRPWQALGVACVIGSESLPDTTAAARLIDHLGRDRAILSLDSHNGTFKGPMQLLEDTTLWPDRVVAMNLNRVGSQAGPDIELLARLQQLAPGKRIYAAGGVRHGEDLQLLAGQGVAGALVASALHDSHITARALKAFYP